MLATIAAMESAIPSQTDHAWGLPAASFCIICTPKIETAHPNATAVFTGLAAPSSLPSLGALVVGALAEALGGVSGAPKAVLLGAIFFLVLLALASPTIERAHIDALATRSAETRRRDAEQSAEESLVAADPEELAGLCETDDSGEGETTDE